MCAHVRACACAPACSLALFPGHQWRLDFFSVLCALAFGRAVSHVIAPFPFDCRLQQNRTSSGILLQRAFRFSSHSHHLWKLPFRFLIWFRDLEPPREQSPRVQSCSWSRSLHHTGCAVCAQAQATLYDRVPTLTYGSCSQFSVYHLSYISVCSHGMSSIHDAISWTCLGGFYLSALQVAQGHTKRTCGRKSTLRVLSPTSEYQLRLLTFSSEIFRFFFNSKHDFLQYMFSINITICSDKWPTHTAKSSEDTDSKIKILMPLTMYMAPKF